MTDDNHAATPGPWYVGKLRLDDNGISQSLTIGTFAADEHFEDSICEVWDGNHLAKANARLIAAAPSLLSALETLADKFESDTVALAGEGALTIQPALDQARSAIAKASK